MRRRDRMHAEQGIALVAGICSLALMLSLSAIALKQAVSALRQSSHQGNVKRALQAADAAIEIATWRSERADIGQTLKIDPLNPASIVGQNCVISTGTLTGVDLSKLDPLSPKDPAGNQWCPESAPETTSDKAAFTYRMSQLLRAGAGPCGSGSGLLNLDRDVVGVGRSGDVTRRITARLRAQISLLSGAAVQSGSASSPLTMAGTARILGDAQSNNSITGSGLNVISGSATTGSGGTVTGVVPAGAKGVACQTFTIPDVDQGTVTTVNDNLKRSDGCTDPLLGLALPCKPLLTTTGGVIYDAAKRTLDVWGNGRTVLTGANYSFCSIRLEGNGVLETQNATPVTRLFLDDPANCPGVTGAGTINVDGQARILNCHAQTAPQSLQLYAVGNAGIPTTQTLAAGALLTGALRGVLCGLSLPVVGEPMTIVAPHSTLELGGSTALAGQVAADVVHLSGLAAVNPVNALVNLNQLGTNPILPLYKATDYVECNGRGFDTLPAADPAQGC